MRARATIAPPAGTAARAAPAATPSRTDVPALHLAGSDHMRDDGGYDDLLYRVRDGRLRVVAGMGEAEPATSGVTRHDWRAGTQHRVRLVREAARSERPVR